MLINNAKIMGAAGRHRSRCTHGAESAENARPSPELCMNGACAGAEDGSTELHTVDGSSAREQAVQEQGNRLAAKDGSRKSRKSRTEGGGSLHPGGGEGAGQHEVGTWTRVQK